MERVLSESQFRTLMEISRFTAVEQFPPTVRQIGDAIDLAPSYVHGIMNKLANYGYINRQKGASRGIRVLVKPCDANLGFDPIKAFAKDAPVLIDRE